MSIDINTILQDLYQAYNQKDLEKMKSLLDQGYQIQPDSKYLLKYQSLYDKLAADGSSESGIDEQSPIKIKGKVLKCKQCGNNINLTGENKQKLSDFQNKVTSDLVLNCTYCNSVNTWAGKSIKPLFLDVRVGQDIVLDNKKYKVSGAVRYKGIRQTNYAGDLEYIERILIDEKGDTYYFSESNAHWAEDGETGVDQQIELSRKIVPDFSIGSMSSSSIKINDEIYDIKEKTNVSVTETFGENSKSYTIGESIETYQFTYKGVDYILEKESSKNQQEMGVYQTWETHYDGANAGGTGSGKKSGSGCLMFILYIILFFVVYMATFSIFSSENSIQVDMNNVVNSSFEQAKGIYKVTLSDKYQQIVSDTTKNYDYGGINHDVKYLDGFRFKIQSQQDFDILKQIYNKELHIQNQNNYVNGISIFSGVNDNLLYELFLNNKVEKFK